MSQFNRNNSMGRKFLKLVRTARMLHEIDSKSYMKSNIKVEDELRKFITFGLHL